MTRPVTVRIDEIVLDGVDEREVAAELVEREVARALAPVPVEGATEIAAEVGRTVEASVGP